jgi:aminoglycoside phosphotransferase (APT) family kinase protein
VNIDECLPSDLRGSATTITKVSAGLSGAGVYRVDAGEHAFVLKVSDASQPLSEWRRTLHIRELAASAGLAPRIVHVDEARRAILSVFVVDRSFRMFYRDPSTHDDALTLLGRTLRRVHELPLPPDADTEARTAHGFLRAIWSGLRPGFSVPPFVGEAVRQVLAEEPPDSRRAPVLSHNDVNPTNLVYDGEQLLLLDWETAGPNDPLYDLAAISVFLRMDEGTCLRLLAAHDAMPVSTLPARFAYDRRLAAVMCGTMFLHLARQQGHAGAAGDETADSTPSLAEIHTRLMSGALSLATAEGQWAFGLALVKEGISR